MLRCRLVSRRRGRYELYENCPQMGPAVLKTFLIAAGAGAFAAGASADLFDRPLDSRQSIFENQVQVLDSRAAIQYENSSRLRPGSSQPFSLNLPGGGNAAARARYLPMVQAAARKHRIPQALFARLVQQESNWNAAAISHKGAIGLAQLMPGTARDLGVDPYDPVQNLDGGARYLRLQYDRFGSWQLALAAYNAGPGAVIEHDGIPPFRETRNYVRAILGPPPG